MKRRELITLLGSDDFSKEINSGAANSPEAIARNVNEYIAMKAGKTSVKTLAPHLIAAASRYKQT